jgi:hypothetical protein
MNDITSTLADLTSVVERIGIDPQFLADLIDVLRSIDRRLEEANAPTPTFTDGATDSAINAVFGMPDIGYTYGQALVTAAQNGEINIPMAILLASFCRDVAHREIPRDELEQF